MNREKQRLRIDRVTQVNPWVRCFRLVSAEGKKLAPFFAGQYLNLFYEIDGATTSRPYSIASSPLDAENGFYELYIHGGGPFTALWLFQHGTEGTVLTASIPEGDFYYHKERDGRKVVGISGGMSVTPLRAMARAVAQGTLDMELTLFCGWDRAEEVLFREDFRRYMKQSPNLKVVFAIDGDGSVEDERGYVTLEMIRRHIDPQGAAFFLCGPEAMYHALERALSPLKTQPSRYHQELPGEVRISTEQWEACTYTLSVRRNGAVREIPMDSRETVLTAMERAGLEPEARCRSGHCGYCLSRLEKGRVFVPEKWEERTEAEKKQGLIHPCCSFPRSDLCIHLS